MSLTPEAEALIAKINKTYGEGSVVHAKDIQIHKRYTTGWLGLDVALGGGWPANQPIEILGRESHGKTAVVLKTIAANQAADPNFTCLWVAAEHYDVDQATALGVDNDRIIVHSTQAMEEAFEVMLAFGEAKAVDAIVLDSYPALIADDEAAKDMDEFATMAVGARLFGKFFRKWGGQVHNDITNPEAKPLLGPIIINQFRDKIGGFSPRGTPQTSPGGNAKNYAYYVRVEVARDEFITETFKGVDTKVGQTIKVKTTKNKSAAPQQMAVIDFYFRDAPKHGFKRGQYDLGADMVLMAVLFGVITKRGAWFYFENGEVDESGKPKHRWQGKEALTEAILADPVLKAAVEAQVRVKAADPTSLNSITEDDVTDAKNAGVRKVSRSTKAKEAA